ncbi:hypothetical protein D9619_001012 [Psilocybe cf. subviscida]|uniref:Mediator of RNA polymerase II transcription subunit 18 n=1 Tax=Psilocybe cf. subviscida TaxID=2480587 RepID=A0A8H5BDT0_9AGAR|nr:hypothetical protein D9619_001012 [Psilocybe cf. subviscida]
MSSHSYEVILFGDFFAKDLKPILNRITLHSDSSRPYQSREVVFEPTGAQTNNTEPVYLRAKKEISDPNAPWEVFSYLKPESVRIHPEATVRPWTTCEVVGDSVSFAAALGFIQRSQMYMRGYAFRRGPLLITMCQQEHLDPKTQLPTPAHTDALWQVEVKTAHPVWNTPETPLTKSVEAVLEVQLLMKGLLDLGRRDV